LTRARACVSALLCAACIAATAGRPLHAQQQDRDMPPAAPRAWLDYLGEYGSTHDPVIVLETGGHVALLFNRTSLQTLRPVRGDTFAFTSDSQRVVFRRNGAHGIAEIALLNARYERRPIAPAEGAVFQIHPVRPVSELERIALRAQPPHETGDFLPSDLVELRDLDPSIRYDIRYATPRNFMGTTFYSSPHAFLQRPAAEALVRVSARLRQRGYGLVIHDAYRPWYVTRMFWDATPDSLRQFVADPSSGSRHNRGAAVDLSLYDLATGETITTVSGYDEFSPRAYADYPGGTSLQRWYRALLRNAMEAEGFAVYDAEWWHFDYHDWRKYRIGNQRFEEIH
jgi:D-alanyl-D-alanine dipeptidase